MTTPPTTLLTPIGLSRPRPEAQQKTGSRPFVRVCLGVANQRGKNERQLPVRIGKRGFQARIKGNLHVEFGEEKLTSFAGLELVRRFLRGLDFIAELRRSERRLAIGGDFSFSKLVLAVVAMLLTGARRLHHVAFLRDDPIFLRFAGLSRAPTERSVGRALGRLSFRTWPELDRLSTLVARAALDEIDAKRWTIDIDGTVLTTGLQVERAERGFNPHHRKNPSYYPILATLAQTGHVVGHKNRRGNIHDSHGSADFLRRTVRNARDELGLAGCIEVRADSAFFQRDFLAACDRLNVEYAIKVPMWPWLNLRGVVKRQLDDAWQWVDRKNGLQGLCTFLYIDAWKRAERIAIYRKRVNHQPAKGRQLELFNPDDGHWEYSVVATNKKLGLRAATRPLALPGRPWRAGENNPRAQEWVRFRCDPDTEVPVEHRVAEAERPRSQHRDELPARNNSSPASAVTQAHGSVRPSKRRHSPLRMAVESRAHLAAWRPPSAAPREQRGDSPPLRTNRARTRRSGMKECPIGARARSRRQTRNGRDRRLAPASRPRHRDWRRRVPGRAVGVYGCARVHVRAARRAAGNLSRGTSSFFSPARRSSVVQRRGGCTRRRSRERTLGRNRSCAKCSARARRTA